MVQARDRNPLLKGRTKLTYHLLLALFCFITQPAFSQDTIPLFSGHKYSQKSGVKAAYRIPAGLMWEWLKNYSIDFDYIETLSPAAVVPDSVHADSVALPPGQYVWVKAEREMLYGDWQQRSAMGLVLMTTGPRHRLRVHHATKVEPVSEGAIHLKKQKLPFDAKSRAWLLPRRGWKEHWMMICMQGDTLLAEMDKPEKHRRYRYSFWDRRFFRNIKRKVEPLFDSYLREDNKWEPGRHNSRKYVGYWMQDKPLYKPGDSLKTRAWVTSRKGKPLRKSLQAAIAFEKNRRETIVELGAIKPEKPGTYLLNMALPDSFPSDTRYDIVLMKTNKKKWIAGNFAIEEYQLPDIGEYKWETPKTRLLTADTIVLEATATDAGGLPVLDATLDYYLVAKELKGWKQDTLFVADTLISGSIPLITNGPTTVKIAVGKLPVADMAVTAIGKLRNSNNEIKEKSLQLTIHQHMREVDYKLQNRDVSISYLEDGKSLPATALLRMQGDEWQHDTVLQLPARYPVHPLAQRYHTTVYSTEGRVLAENAWTDAGGDLSGGLPNMYTLYSGDSVGFRLVNPEQLPVYITFAAARNTLLQQTFTDADRTWWQKANAGTVYFVTGQYTHLGTTTAIRKKIALPYQLLTITTTPKPVAAPGEKDSLRIRVTDYKNRPAAHVSLAAVAQNAQLKQYFNWPNLPYRMKYARSKTRKTSRAEWDIGSRSNSRPLQGFTQIRHHLGADTIPYYQWLFSPQWVTIHTTPLKTSIAEVAVHAQKNGQPEPLYIVYINRRPVWYRGANTLQAYSSRQLQGWTRIGIRTRDAWYEQDSIYLQPYRKHEIFLNLNAADTAATVRKTPMPDTLTHNEKAQLDEAFIRLEHHFANEQMLLWQEGTLAQTGSTTGNWRYNKPWIAGPFRPAGEITAWKPDTYRTPFIFEPGYQYRFGGNAVRLEKMPLITEKVKLDVSKTYWQIGDTLYTGKLPPPLPVRVRALKPLLELNNPRGDARPGLATLRLLNLTDSLFTFTVLVPEQEHLPLYVLPGSGLQFHHIKPGRYRLLFATLANKVADAGSIMLYRDGYNGVKVKPTAFTATHPLLDSIRLVQAGYAPELPAKRESDKQQEGYLLLPLGNATIAGRVTTASGEPIASAIVRLKDSKIAIATHPDGSYRLAGLPEGEFTIEVVFVGFEPQQKTVAIFNRLQNTVDFVLKTSESRLEEVVVLGYGTTRKSSFTGSVTTVMGDGFENSIQGKVAGVQIHSMDQNIRIRGIGTIQSDNKPLYVVDGVPMDDVPADLMENASSVEVLTGSVGASLYGSRGAQGVIVITTGGRPPVTLIRSKFSDNAYWQPSITTNRRGEAMVPISYPDNMTQWQHAVYASGKKHRHGRAFFETRVFKPLQAQLSVPSFLIEGDSTQIVGKALNYTESAQTIQTGFEISGSKQEQSFTADAQGSAIAYQSVVAPAAPDTIKPVFTITGPNGQSDGEERIIPVMARGTIESTGAFMVLGSDTVATHQPTYAGEPITVGIYTHLIDALEAELEQLRNYPHACMEQIANKLWGLSMIEQVRKTTGGSFQYKRQQQQLLEQLLRNQHISGGWSWWPAGQPNLHITTRVLQALRHVTPTPQTADAIRLGFIYLQNQLPQLPRYAKMEALYALAEGGHKYPYRPALDSIPFDSIGLHQQWQYVRILQRDSADYAPHMQKLWNQRSQTMTGGLYWGTHTWYWYANEKATTVVAARVLVADSAYGSYLPQLRQYLMEVKSKGFQNTVERAEITHLLLAGALQTASLRAGTPRISINGQRVEGPFPYRGKIPPSATVQVDNAGGSMAYIGLSQQWLNRQPQRVDSLFAIDTWFEQKRVRTDSLKAGETTQMQVRIHAKKDAEFVQIEIPIPAGCSYASKPQSRRNEHREYLKDRVLIFVENMRTGVYEYTLPLEVRYTGRYTLNPAKAELMYFPMLYGREGMKDVEVGW